MSRLVTRIIVISDESSISPGKLLVWAQATSENVELKETCFGLIVQGETEAVLRVLRDIRGKAPFEVFSKERAFCMGDRSRCRVGRKGVASGSSRPGFHQLEKESRLLSNVAIALRATNEKPRQSKRSPTPTKKGISEKELELLVKGALSCKQRGVV